MKRAFSSLISLIKKLIIYWRTRKQYACRKGVLWVYEDTEKIKGAGESSDVDEAVTSSSTTVRPRNVGDSQGEIDHDIKSDQLEEGPRNGTGQCGNRT